MARRMPTLPPRSPLAHEWDLDNEIVFLNHGSFGACPRLVMTAQHELRRRMEAEPVRFFIRELPELLETARTTVAGFLGADPEGLAFVANATAGVNTALAAIPFGPGEEILVTDHGYPACRNAAETTARAAGAHVIEATVPFPISSPDQVLEAVLGTVTDKTRAAVLDHVTSPTGLVFPIEGLAAELGRRGVIVIIDGAHAPGMLDLDLDSIGAPFYTGNCHKWLCAPKGAAILWVRDDWRAGTRPLVISHGASAPATGGRRFRLEFDWTGTADPTPWLSVPTAITVIESMLEGGWDAVRNRNRTLVIKARDEICAALGVEPPCPASMIGSLAALPLPSFIKPEPVPANGVGRLQNRLFTDFGIEVPVTVWAESPRNAVRISAHLYNEIEEYRHLASALQTVFSELPPTPLRD